MISKDFSCNCDKKKCKETQEYFLKKKLVKDEKDDG
jgi:hypothetical protein